MTAELITYADPRRFRAAAAAFLAADPVRCTVLSSGLAQAIEETPGDPAPGGADGSPDPAPWFALLRDAAGAVVSAAMWRPPFPPYLLPMPNAAATELAERSLTGRVVPTGANGAEPAARAFAETVAARTGGRVELAMANRLFRLGELTPPEGVPGRPVAATIDDRDLLIDWTDAFQRDTHIDGPRSASVELAQRFLRSGTAWLWRDDDDRPVSLAAGRPPAFGVARVGPVYTPPEHRRRGYGAAITAHAAATYRAQGVDVCLFTDLANPTSNAIYQQIGFRPVGDEVRLVITGAA